MLQTKALSFSYPGHTFMFPDITCAAKNGLLITGTSGKGKTTLLHLLAGLLKPDSGSIVINGTNLSSMSGRALDRFRGAHIGIVFQQSHFVQSLTVEENLLLANAMAGKKKSRMRARHLLGVMNMAGHENKKPAQLSQGQQQRVSIARALINNPSLILADEPTSSLDDTHCEAVVQLLLQQSQAAGAALLIVTHDHRLRAFFNEEIMLP